MAPSKPAPRIYYSWIEETDSEKDDNQTDHDEQGNDEQQADDDEQADDANRRRRLTSSAANTPAPDSNFGTRLPTPAYHIPAVNQDNRARLTRSPSNIPSTTQNHTAYLEPMAETNPDALQTMTRDMGPQNSQAVHAEPDSGDETILGLRQSGYADRDIARVLVNEGRIPCMPSNMGGRWQRLEGLFNEELPDWQIGRDDLLAETFARARVAQEEEIERVRNNLSGYVAEEINRLYNDPRYNNPLCEERHEAVLDGNAPVPIEVDNNLQARVEECVEQSVATRARELEETEAAKRAAQEANQTQRNKDIAREEARLKREKAAAAREAARRSDEHMRNLKESERIATQTLQAINSQRRKAEIAYNQRKRACENALLKTSVKADRKRNKILAPYSSLAPLPSHLAHLRQPPGPPIPWRSSPRRLTPYKPEFAREELVLEERHNAEGPPHSGLPFPILDPALEELTGPPTDQTLFGDEPRLLMTLRELYELLRERGLPLGRMKLIKEVVVSKIKADDESLADNQCQAILRRHQLPENGTREEMLRRIAEADARGSERYKTLRSLKPTAEETATNTQTSTANANATGQAFKKSRFFTKPQPVDAPRYNPAAVKKAFREQLDLLVPPSQESTAVQQSTETVRSEEGLFMDDCSETNENFASTLAEDEGAIGVQHALLASAHGQAPGRDRHESEAADAEPDSWYESEYEEEADNEYESEPDAEVDEYDYKS